MILPRISDGVSRQGKLSTPEEELHNCLGFAENSFLTGHTVAMVTYCVTKLITVGSIMIGQSFETKIVASIDKEL